MISIYIRDTCQNFHFFQDTTAGVFLRNKGHGPPRMPVTRVT